MRRQRVEPDGSVITEETPVRLSLKELCALIGAVVFVALGGFGSWLSLKQDVRELSVGIKLANDRLGAMEQRQMKADEALQQRLADWNPWRWRVSYDVVQLGRKTGTETLTHEEGK